MGFFKKKPSEASDSKLAVAIIATIKIGSDATAKVTKLIASRFIVRTLFDERSVF